MQKVITCVNDDKKMLKFNINLAISKNFKITSVKWKFKMVNIVLYDK